MRNIALTFTTVVTDVGTAVTVVAVVVVAVAVMAVLVALAASALAAAICTTTAAVTAALGAEYLGAAHGGREFCAHGEGVRIPVVLGGCRIRDEGRCTTAVCGGSYTAVAAGE